VPAQVRNPKDPFAETKNYWFLHIWNRISCLNREQSEVDIDEDDGMIWDIDKLVLDEEKLNAFKLEQRLIFELAEDSSVILIHQSIKDVIMSVNPTGFRFVNASEWYSDIVFD